MRYVAKAIVVEIELEHIDANEVVFFFKLMNRFAEIYQKVFVEIISHSWREREHNADGFRAVSKAQFDIVLEDLSILLRNVDRKKFRIVFPICHRLNRKTAVELFFYGIEI